MSHLGPRTVAAFLDDAFSPRKRATVGRHLISCAECRTHVSGAKVLLAQIGDSSADSELGRWVEAYLGRVSIQLWPEVAATDSRLHHAAVAQYLSARADDLQGRGG